MGYLQMMSKKAVGAAVAVASLLPAAIQSAHAELGDTYATSCQRYGGPGYVDRENRMIIWMTRQHIYFVIEQFLKNQCVCVFYVRKDRQPFTEPETQHLLVVNARQTQYWQEYPDIGGRSFQTTDEKITGRLWVGDDRTPVLRIAYANWVARHGLFRAPPTPPPTQPPVEEEPKPQPSRPTNPPIEEQA
jgi:hypothetical protein